MYEIKLTSKAKKQAEVLQKSNLNEKAKKLVAILRNNPLSPPFEKLKGFKDTYSRRINAQHRLVYHINDLEKIITILSCWTHYE